MPKIHVQTVKETSLIKRTSKYHKISIQLHIFLIFIFKEVKLIIISDDSKKLDSISDRLLDLIFSYILEEDIENETIKSFKDEKVA